MKKTILFILIALIAIETCACSLYTDNPGYTIKNENPKIEDLLVENYNKFDIASVEVKFSLSNDDLEKYDSPIWEKACEIDQYIHEFDDFKKVDDIEKNSSKFVNTAKRVDEQYSHEFNQYYFYNQYSKKYKEATERFFNAAEDYTLYGVMYAQFGGNNYRGMVIDSEKRIKEERENVVNERIKYILAGGGTIG